MLKMTSRDTRASRPNATAPVAVPVSIPPIATPVTPPAAAAAIASPSARMSERQRIAAIVNHPEAVGRDALAKHLAFETDTPAADAVAHLMAAPRGPSAIAAAAMGAAATARAALGLAPDAARDLATAQGVEAAFAGRTVEDPTTSARWSADYAAGAAAARELLGK